MPSTGRRGLSTVNVNCFGDATGSITTMVTGGTPGTTGYLYEWTTGATTPDLDNLVSDNYFVTVTDELGCTVASGTGISEPPVLTNTATADNVSCFGDANGSVFVQANGGTSPYEYIWNTGSTDQLLEDLSPGTYTVTMTDAFGCTNEDILEVTEPTELMLSSSTTDIDCYGAFTGEIDLTISGGTSASGSYSTSWSTGQFSEDIDQLSAGNYEVIITDDNGCQILENFTLIQSDELIPAVIAADVSCYEYADGSVSVTVSGGNAPYTYDWSTGETTEQIGNLPAGDYAVTITDVLGCEISAESEVTEPELLFIPDYFVQEAGCKTGADGSVNITVEGGTPDYSFNWSNGVATEDIEGVPGGSYTVTVSDANACSVSQTFDIGETPSSFKAFFLAASGLFDVDSVEVNADDIIHFIDVSHPNPIEWEWHFGDPDTTTSNLANPVFSYPNDPGVAQSSYDVTLVASNLYCSDSITKRIWITNNMRLIDTQRDSAVYLEFTKVLAYPNPSSGRVTLEVELSKEKDIRVAILDVAGKWIDGFSMEGDDAYTTELDLGHLAQGMYLIRIQADNEVYTVRIVITGG